MDICISDSIITENMYIDFSHDLAGELQSRLFYGRMSMLLKKRMASLEAQKMALESNPNKSRNDELDLMLIRTKMDSIREETLMELYVLLLKGELKYTRREKWKALLSLCKFHSYKIRFVSKGKMLKYL